MALPSPKEARPGPAGPPRLFLFAVPEEARPFIAKLRGAGLAVASRSADGAGHTRPAWSFDGGEARVTGMGRENAARGSVPALALRPEMVLTCGFAGGLDPALPGGTVVFDADPGFPLVDRLTAVGAVPVRFHCADHVAVTVADKAALRASTGADAVEMESSVIRAMCRERGIPSATVRVVSDAADEDLPLDFNALMTPGMDLHFGKLAWRLVRSPGKIPELVRFQKRVAHAADRLAEALSGMRG
jgi:hypothetical protein